MRRGERIGGGGGERGKETVREREKGGGGRERGRVRSAATNRHDHFIFFHNVSKNLILGRGVSCPLRVTMVTLKKKTIQEVREPSFSQSNASMT